MTAIQIADEPQFFDAAELHGLLLKAQPMPGADVRVLLYFATAVPVGEAVPKTASDVGRELGLSTTSASRSVNRLLSADWLEFAYEAAGLRFYRLGPAALPEEPETEQPDQGLAVVRELRPRDNC